MILSKFPVYVQAAVLALVLALLGYLVAHAAVHRQHFPVCAGRQRGFHPAGADALRRGLSPYAGNETGPVQGHHLTRMAPSPRYKAVYVPADDLTDPATATTFAHLDATTVLSGEIFRADIAAMDPLESSPDWRRTLWVDGALPHRRRCRNAAKISGCRANIAYHLGMDELSDEDQQTVNRARRIQRFLAQPACNGKILASPVCMSPLKETLNFLIVFKCKRSSSVAIRTSNAQNIPLKANRRLSKQML